MVEFGVGQKGGDVHRHLDGKRIRQVIDPQCKGVGAMVEHLLCKLVMEQGGLDAEVAEHGIRFPAPKEMDVVRVNSGAQEGGCPAWAEGASTEERGIDSSDGFECIGRMAKCIGGMAKCIGDVHGFDGIPVVVARMSIVVVMDQCIGWHFVDVEVPGKVAKSLGQAEEWVIGGAVAYLLALDSILLVKEC